MSDDVPVEVSHQAVVMGASQLTLKDLSATDSREARR